MGLLHVLDIRLKQASVRTALALTTYRILRGGAKRSVFTLFCTFVRSAIIWRIVSTSAFPVIDKLQ